MAAEPLPPDYFNRPVAEVDPEIAATLQAELVRQDRTLEMIASENFAPQAVLDCQGSVLTNKYAEGYPGKRYYGGCEHVDEAERLAIARARELFAAEHANVQPHAGAQANAAAYHALLQAGDRILGMKLDHGGHLTHGMRLNFSGRLYEVTAYGVREEDSRVDMEELERLAHEHRPKAIVAGWSAYPRQLDFAAFRAIADAVDAFLIVDMAHFAGLVAAGEHPSPIPHADVVTTTTHKTLDGPRAGLILCREEHAKKINSAVFPGQQGGPLMHAVAAKAVALRAAASDVFRERQRRTRAGADALAEELLEGGVNVLTGGTEVHLVLVDLRDSQLDGQQAEDRLAEVGITVNRNAVPFDPRPPAVSSGLRIGTPALATRGFTVDDFREVGRVIVEALTGEFDDAVRSALSERTQALAERYPLYPHLRAADRRAAAGTAAGGAGSAPGPAAPRDPEPPPPPPRTPVPGTAGGGGTGAAPPAVFELRDVSASRGGEVVLRGVSLDLHRGATAVLGPSGSGKSTLLRLLNRLADPDTGTIAFSGRDIRELDVLDLRRRVGLVPQLPAPLPGTVRDNVLAGPALAGREASVEGALELAGLPHSFSDRDADRLSVGEQQRLMLARALALDPEVLLLDEPTSALDERAREGVERTIVGLCERPGTSTVLVTHDRDQARRLASRTVELSHGRVRAAA